MFVTYSKATIKPTYTLPYQSGWLICQLPARLPACGTQAGLAKWINGLHILAGQTGLLLFCQLLLDNCQLLTSNCLLPTANCLPGWPYGC
jgi:hypothetical protein